jgi:serine O-acetyltransferase
VPSGLVLRDICHAFNTARLTRSRTIDTVSTLASLGRLSYCFCREAIPSPCRGSLFVSGLTDRAGASGLFEQIIEDWKAHGRDWMRPGFQAVALHRFGTWRMGIGPKALRVPFSAVYKALYQGVRNFYGIELPYTARIGRRVVIEHQSGIVVHGHTAIGDDCILRQGVTLGNRRSDRPQDAPQLGERVSVGAGAKILGAVVVGSDAQIGANAVVLSDIPPGGLAVGIPARLVPRGHVPEP